MGGAEEGETWEVVAAEVKVRLSAEGEWMRRVRGGKGAILDLGANSLAQSKCVVGQ